MTYKKQTTVLWYPATVTDNLRCLNKWRPFWCAPIWLPPQTPGQDLPLACDHTKYCPRNVCDPTICPQSREMKQPRVPAVQQKRKQTVHCSCTGCFHIRWYRSRSWCRWIPGDINTRIELLGSHRLNHADTESCGTRRYHARTYARKFFNKISQNRVTTFLGALQHSKSEIVSLTRGFQRLQ